MIYQKLSWLMKSFVLQGFLCLFVFSAICQDFDVKKLKSLSMEELLGIEVTSVSKRKEKMWESPSAIQVITGEDIRNSGVTSIPEALRLVANLQVAQVNASQWAISSRGFNNVLANKLLVLIDGRVVYTPMYAGVFWDVQNLLLEDIERIEVISGSGGTLWGANAVNGVINIITKSAESTQGLYAEAALGTELRALGSLRYGGKINDKLFYRFHGTAFKRDNTIFTDSIEANDSWHMGQGGLRVDWIPSDKDALMFQSNLYEGRPDPDGGSPVVASGGNIVARWNHTYNEESGFQVQAFYDRTWRDFRNGFAEELTTYDIEGHHRFTLGKRHGIIYGFGARLMDHEVRNLELFAFKPARKSLYLYNAFVQDEVNLIEDKLRLTLGIKLEHNSYTQFQYQPNARLTWTPRNHLTIWGAVSRAVRNPARIDREFYLYLTPELPLISGNEFQSEELFSYELGAKLQLAKDVSISASQFYNNYDNIRSAEPGPAPFGIPITFGNGVKGISYGSEIAVVAQPLRGWSLRGGFTLLQKDLSVKPNSKDWNNASAESNDPTHQVLIQSNVRATERFNIGTVIRYVSELPSPVVSGYVEMDIQLRFNVSDAIEINLVGQNLMQKNHAEFIPESPEPKEIERSVYGKVICRF